MQIERIWTGNAWRNYNYLVACAETGEALAIDPTDHEKCLHTANEHGWRITQVLNTHEHYDHTSGNDAVVAATGARLLAHRNAAPNVPRMDRGLGAGDVIRIGRSVELECLDTPGHTLAHVCLLAHTDEPALFCGDTLFSAGAGNCHNGGHPHVLYETFSTQLAKLDDGTRVFPGHDYLARNLSFTLDREPDNALARQMLPAAEAHDPAAAPVTTIGIERAINTFMRLRSPGVIRGLRATMPTLPETPDEKAVFLALRELRNKW